MSSKPHPHAALMAEYAKDAAVSETPWIFWQYRISVSRWGQCLGTPRFDKEVEYRRIKKAPKLPASAETTLRLEISPTPELVQMLADMATKLKGGWSGDMVVAEPSRPRTLSPSTRGNLRAFLAHKRPTADTPDNITGWAESAEELLRAIDEELK